MFGFLKSGPAPEGPTGIAGNVEIAKPVEEVYALLDWSHPENAQRQRGATITSIESETGRFEMRLPALPKHVFEIAVTEEVPNGSYGFTVTMDPIVGRMASLHELYTLERLGPETCRLWLLNTVTFTEGLNTKQYKEELRKMTVASHNALAKFKLHAEQGLEAVTAMDGKITV